MKLRLLFILILLFPLTPVARVSAQQVHGDDALRKAVGEELSGPLFRRCLAAVEIAEAATGKVLYSRNESLLLRPASNAKLFPSGAAVLGLPEDFRFETRLAVVDSGSHTLVCIGGGDPLFSAQDIQKLAEIAFLSGVTRVDTLILDATLYSDDYFGRGWMWDDENDPFTPYIGAFSVGNNTVTLRARWSARSGSALVVTSDPASSIFSIRRNDGDAANDTFRIERRPRSNEFLVHGGLRRGSRARTERFSIWRPQDLFADLLRNALRQRGLAADSMAIRFGAAPLAVRPLGVVQHPLAEVLTAMNKSSDNLCAEAVLRALSFGTGRKRLGVSADDGIAALQSILAKHGISADDIALCDGSGISFYNLVSASAIGRLLRVLAAHPGFPRYRESLAIGGIDGTLAHRMAGLPHKQTFRGKTGTVRGVSALSGYVQAPGGRLLTVVILMQNFVGKHGPYREVQDRIVRHCVEYSASINAVTAPR
jgi:D-alanyl-D-alanine carboxypeptidase/D-alanyl-D-alanine-endopeptidase (penicillin-binding protein 4)